MVEIIEKNIYQDYGGKDVTREEFIALRDMDILVFGNSFYEVGEDYLMLVDPMKMMVVR